MSIELVRARPEHLDHLARICHVAFDSLHQHHKVHRDVPSEDVGKLIIGGVLHRDDYTGVAAVRGGRIVGSNFLQHADEVCGVGPITVDPGVQAAGVGRTLMRWVIDEARARRGGGVRVRLYQEALNSTSLSLYASLGFRWTDTAAMMTPRPAASDDPTIRAMVPGDLPAVADLSARCGGFSRANDAARLLSMGFPALVRERAGRVVGYQFATLFGHAAAETDEDLLALASQTARLNPPPMAVIIVPMSRETLFSAALAAGYRVLKVLNGMAIGEQSPREGPSLPSIQC